MKRKKNRITTTITIRYLLVGYYNDKTDTKKKNKEIHSKKKKIRSHSDFVLSKVRYTAMIADTYLLTKYRRCILEYTLYMYSLKKIL